MADNAAPLPQFAAEVRLDGLATPAATVASQEIAITVQILVGICEALHLTADTSMIQWWVPTDFDAAVNTLLRDNDREDEQPYASQRLAGRAVGKTIFSRDLDRVHATIVLSPDLWGQLEGWAVFSRITLMLHEILHVVFEADRRAKGVSPPRPAAERTFAESLPVLASVAYEECTVDANLDDVVRAMQWLRDGEGHVVKGLLRPEWPMTSRQRSPFLFGSCVIERGIERRV